MLIKHKNKIFAAAALGLLIFLHLLGVLRPLENIITRALNPLMQKLAYAGAGIRIAYQEQSAKRDFAQIAKDLESEVARLTEENAKLSAVAQENEILREHLGFLERRKYEYVMSNIISREDIFNAGGQTEALIIDKGRRDGLFEGLALVSEKGIIIGKIAEVKENTAKAYLANSDKCKFAAVVLDQNGTGGIAQGNLGLVIKMNFIPQSAALAAGNVVITSGLEQAIPRGLVIGKITEIQKENNDLWQNATIESILDASDLIVAAVILPESADSADAG